jgi:hypothetical protein
MVLHSAVYSVHYSPCLIYCIILISPSFLSSPLALIMSSAHRKSRRLSSPSSSFHRDLSTQLTLPEGCHLVANTFVIFKWQDQCCLLQTNLTLYCWGGRRSGALEYVLENMVGLIHLNSIASIPS